MARRAGLHIAYLTIPKGRRNYVYRREIPAHLRPFIGCSNWVRAFRLGTDEDDITREVKRLTTMHDAMIERAKTGEVMDAKVIAASEATARQWIAGKAVVSEWNESDMTSRDRIADSKEDLHRHIAAIAFHAKVRPDDPRLVAMLNALEHGGSYQPETMTMAQARAKRGLGDRDEKPVDYAMKSFAPFARDRDVREITRDDVAAWIKACRAKDRKPKPLRPSAVKRRMVALHAIMAYALLDLGSGQANWFKARAHANLLKGGAAEVTKRQPFNHAMLAAIDSYLAESKRLRETRHILILLKNTGAMPSEIGGLVLGDLSLDGDVPYLWIRRNALRDLKVRETEDGEAPARDRIVPLIGDGLVVAREAYARALKRANGKSIDDAPLFYTFKPGPRAADSISSAGNRIIRKAGVPESERLVLYSFRHTVKAALRKAGIAPHLQDALMGHAGASVEKNYGATYEALIELRDALDKALHGVNAKGVRFLGDIGSLNYTAQERMAESKPATP